MKKYSHNIVVLYKKSQFSEQHKHLFKIRSSSPNNIFANNSNRKLFPHEQPNTIFNIKSVNYRNIKTCQHQRTTASGTDYRMFHARQLAIKFLPAPVKYT